MLKRTKIVCTIGPSSNNKKTMKEMASAGMNVIRVNFSHGDYEQYSKILETLDEVRRETGFHIGLMYDTNGPDFRVGEIEENTSLIEGENVKIVKKEIIGNSHEFSVNYPDVLKKIKVGDNILINDGLIKLEVINCEKSGVNCKIINGGPLLSHKGVAIPGVNLEIPFMSEKDIKDIEYACHHDGDFLALSFVNTKEDVIEARKIIDKNHSNMKIISKIESKVGIDNLDEIIEVSDGIMVARGDLGVELPIQELPIYQKLMISKCREQGKFCIVATEMLASMTNNIRPTRAEVSDVSNAVLDGSDAVMLSEETAAGINPVLCVKCMSDIVKEAEEYYDYDFEFDYQHDKAITAGIARAVVSAISEVDAKAIVVPTTGGHSARVMSNLKPVPIIIAICPDEKVARSLSLNFGVYPTVTNFIDELSEIIDVSRKASIELLGLKKKDVIVITGGIHKEKEVNQTNFLKIEEI